MLLIFYCFKEEKVKKCTHKFIAALEKEFRLIIDQDPKVDAEKDYMEMEYNYFLSAFMCILKCRREYVQILEIVCLFQTGCVIKCL